MRKLLYAILLIMMMIPLACSNPSSGKMEFYSNADKVFVSSESESVLSFEVTLFTKSKVTNLEFGGFEGTNVENSRAELINNTVDQIKNHKHKGYYISIVMVNVMPEDGEHDIEINKMVLLLDGKPNKVHFTTPIKHTFAGGNVFTNDFVPYILPNEFSTQAINNENDTFIYQFEAKEAIELQSIYTLDHIKPIISDIKVDGQLVEKDELLPLSIPADSVVEIALMFEGKTNELDMYHFVSTNLYFEYINVKTSEKQANVVALFFNPIYPIEDSMDHINRFIDHVIYK
ncbi:hypothetical protein [Bacillus sp. FJAT-45066]|uniref:hypothetical protein n=1 Tax=Bacillus sp. FJAT-45066 TaxID=2011010 RepID=UPI000BB78935|nr:hypothetical protein [Bacillus sp. FJAT-45066]